MTKSNFRLNIIEKDSGKNTGHIDINGELVQIKDSIKCISDMLGEKYLVIIGRCPEYDNIEDKLAQIIELLKNRSKHE